MEKLVMLLDIYEEEVVGVHSVGEHITEKDEVWIISKKFGFIKWLVENEKIDFSQIPNKIKEIGIPMKTNGEIKYGFDSSDYYWLLMLLSIQDEPIEFLISILK